MDHIIRGKRSTNPIKKLLPWIIAVSILFVAMVGTLAWHFLSEAPTVIIPIPEGVEADDVII